MTAISKPLSGRRSLSRRSLLSELKALVAVFKREWIIFRRYPSWIFALFIWPIIFPAGYILSGRALSGPDGSGLELFAKATGTHDFLGYIAVGTTIWMWQNVVLWNVGTSLREEQMRGTLESNWLSSTWRFSFLLGASLTHVLTMLVFLAISAAEFGLLFGVQFHGSPLLLLLVLLVCMPSIYGLGFAFASLVINAREVRVVRATGARPGDGLLRDHLPDQFPAGLDARGGGLAAPDLYDPRHPQRGADRRRLAGRLAGYPHAAAVWGGLAGDRLRCCSTGWNAAPAVPGRLDNIK